MSERVASIADQPEWMQRGIEQQNQKSIQMELRAAHERMAAMCLEKYGPEFLGDFLHWLGYYASKLIDIGKSGRMEKTSAPDQGPQIYQLHVRNGEPFYRSTYSTVQFDAPNGRLISCHAVEGNHRNIDLAPLPTMSGIGAVWIDRTMPLTAKETASEVIREIVNRIDSGGW